MGLQRGKNFRQMLEAHGYDPGEALVQARAVIQREIEEAEAKLMEAEGRTAGGGKDARYWRGRLVDLKAYRHKIDETLLPYAHPKLTASKVDADVKGDVTIEIVRHAAD